MDFKPHNHIELSVSIHISPANMNRSCLSACRTKTNGVRINGGRIKAIDTENCHIDIFDAVRIYSISIPARSNVNGNQHLSLELNRPDIADADTGIS